MSHRIVARPDEQEQRAGRSKSNVAKSKSGPYHVPSSSIRTHTEKGGGQDTIWKANGLPAVQAQLPSALAPSFAWQACIRRGCLLPMYSISDQHLRMHTLRYDR